MQARNLPRSDVGSGGLAGALSVLLMLAFGGEEFDYEAVSAAIAVVLTFLGGYIPSEYKPFWTAVAAPVAALIASGLSVFIFDVPIGQTIVITAVSSIAVALFTYIVPPYSASPLDSEGEGRNPRGDASDAAIAGRGGDRSTS